MTYEQALHRLDNWYENNCVEISPELLECYHDALQKVIEGKKALEELQRTHILLNEG